MAEVAGMSENKIIGRSIRVGEYKIARFGADAFLILHDSGEGMEVSAEKLEALIDDFYKREF